MSIYEIFVLAIVLSIDAFIVAFSYGLNRLKKPKQTAFFIAWGTGLFQFLMPLLGAVLTNIAKEIIGSYANYLGGAIFVVLGIKLFWEANKFSDEIKENSTNETSKELSVKELFSISFATSIDAFAAGGSLTLLNAPLVMSAVLIGVVTFSFALVGFFGADFLKNLLSSITKNAPNLLGKFGGIILILIGLKTIFL